MFTIFRPIALFALFLVPTLAFGQDSGFGRWFNDLFGKPVQVATKADHAHQVLYVCLKVDTSMVPMDMIDLYEQELAAYMKDYNQRDEAYTLVACQEGKNPTLYLYIEDVSLISKGRQKFNSVLMLIPPLIIGFPRNTSIGNMGLSRDIAEPGKEVGKLRYTTHAIFMWPDKQKAKHSRALSKYMEKIMSRL